MFYDDLKSLLFFLKTQNPTESFMSLLRSALTLEATYCTFVIVQCSDRMFYLYREPSATYAVFGAR